MQTQAEEYVQAKVSYRKAIELLKSPKYCDPFDSLAQVCEMDGDIAGAVEARKMELESSEKDWNCTTGETVDVLRREIARLGKLLSACPDGNSQE